MACEGLLWDKNQPCRSGESGDEVSRVDREYRKCGREGYCRVDRENREMSRGACRLWSYQFESRVVHTKTQPSPDSPDLHGQTQRRGKAGCC